MALLREKLTDPENELAIVEYLKTPLDKEGLKGLLKKLNRQPSGLVRKKEKLYKELGLKTAGEEEILSAMAEHPVLMERPVVTRGDKAEIGRPLENILELF